MPSIHVPQDVEDLLKDILSRNPMYSAPAAMRQAVRLLAEQEGMTVDPRPGEDGGSTGAPVSPAEGGT